MVARFGRRLMALHQARSRLGFMLGAVLFSWDRERIIEEDMDAVIDDMDHIEHLKDPDQTYQHYMDQWEVIIDEDHLKLWRKPLPHCNYLYEYKVYGTFYDIPSTAFFMVQVDCEYRKKWDKLVIDLEVVDSDENSGCEVVHWVTHYPFPMYSRDYVFKRRVKIDYKRSVMVLVARAVEHHDGPVSDKYVRVTQYMSQMVIRPHRGFDDNGFDYTLTYCDDPQAPFPAPAYSWMARKGLPDFVEKLHVAAKQYKEKHGSQNFRKVCAANINNSPPSIQINYAS